jgi:transglutaminase-like putative cysteine protease
MKLVVSHRTEYRFDTPIRGVVQSHRLTPTSNLGQNVLHWSVEVPGALVGAAFRDGAGDWVQTVSLRSEVEALVVEVGGEVLTEDLSGVLKGHRESVHPLVYLRTTRATDGTHEVRELAQDAVAGETEILGRAHALSRAVRGAVDYVPSMTDSSTTAAEALDLGKGVCQDHAHLLIAAAICTGIPARYVAGYLYADGAAGQAEASHAWAELHVEGLGWIGFDPANECCPDARYIRIGSGFDAQDAAPIRGVSSGQATEHLDVSVSVGQVQQ